MHQENKESCSKDLWWGQRKVCELPQKCHSTTQEEKSDRDVLDRIMLTAVLSLVFSGHCWTGQELSSSKNATPPHNSYPDKDEEVWWQDDLLRPSSCQGKTGPGWWLDCRDCQGHGQCWLINFCVPPVYKEFLVCVLHTMQMIWSWHLRSVFSLCST